MVHAMQLATVTTNGIGFKVPKSRFERAPSTALRGDSHITLQIIVPIVGQNKSVTQDGAFPIALGTPSQASGVNRVLFRGHT